MKLLPEHGHNVTPYLRQGVFFLLLKGEVVYFADSQNIFRDIVEIADMDATPFDAFSYVQCRDQEEAEWMMKQMEGIYK